MLFLFLGLCVSNDKAFLSTLMLCWFSGFFKLLTIVETACETTCSFFADSPPRCDFILVFLTCFDLFFRKCLLLFLFIFFDFFRRFTILSMIFNFPQIKHTLHKTTNYIMKIYFLNSFTKVFITTSLA